MGRIFSFFRWLFARKLSGPLRLVLVWAGKLSLRLDLEVSTTDLAWASFTVVRDGIQANQLPMLFWKVMALAMFGGGGVPRRVAGDYLVIVLGTCRQPGVAVAGAVGGQGGHRAERNPVQRRWRPVAGFVARVVGPGQVDLRGTDGSGR